MPKYKSKQHIQKKECFSRMNFLYQAATLMAGQNNVLSAYYGVLCRDIGKKSTTRMEPNIKRDLCKKCCLAQKPGITSHLSAVQLGVTNGNQIKEEIQHTCNLCGYQRRLQLNPNYRLWLENPESIEEVCTLNNQTEQHKTD